MTSSAVRRAIAAYESGAWAEAEAACAEILGATPAQPDALQILGNIRARSGDTQAAEPFLERARIAAPGNIFILNSLGGVYAANGRRAEARAVLEAALAIDGNFPWALHNLGALLVEAGDREAAKRCFERALAVRPDHFESIAALADLAEKANRLDDAQALAARANALAPGFPAARMVLAQLDVRAARHAAAEETLRALLAKTGLRPGQQAAAHWMLGQALEGQARFDEAFTAYAAANDIDRAIQEPRLANREFASSPTTIAKLTAFIEVSDTSQWTKSPADNQRKPVFLVGFPRSGTTLLQQVLAGHPDIVTLEERESLRDAHQPLLLAPGALERWTSLPPAELGEQRRAYWRRVDKELPEAATGFLFIDKLPLNLALLPLIHLLFPESRIILALRDPRDVIVSCFRSRFEINAAMYQFLSLDSAASYYDAVMSVADISRRKLPLALHVLRYEDLIDDLRGQSEKLLDFLGLPWTDEVLDYSRTVGQRTIRTPSATQVIKPIYRTAMGQWRNYERELAPVLPVLEFWVRKFGYI